MKAIFAALAAIALLSCPAWGQGTQFGSSQSPFQYPVNDREFIGIARQIKPWLQFPPQTMRSEACTEATDAMLNALPGAGFGFDPSGMTNSEATIGNKYKRSCFYNLAKINARPDGNAILDTVGVLTIGNRAFCMVTRVGPNRFVTAQHCFIDATAASPLMDRFDPADPPQIYLLKDLTQPYSVNMDPIIRLAAIATPYSNPQDLIELSLTADSAQKLPPFDAPIIQAPQIGDDLILIGVGTYWPSENWRDDLIWDNGRACKVADRSEEGCIIYGCQSSPNFSGAPLILRQSSSKMTVIGMHLAPSSADGGCNISSPFEGIGNIGRWPFDKLLDR